MNDPIITRARGWAARTAWLKFRKTRAYCAGLGRSSQKCGTFGSCHDSHVRTS